VCVCVCVDWFAFFLKQCVANTTVSWASLAIVDFGHIFRSAVYSRYNNGPTTLPWVTLSLAG
jgi:hypothetical protein